MELKKKWAVNNTPNRLSDNEMKNVVAGYGDGYGDGGGHIIVWICGNGGSGTCGWRSAVEGGECVCSISESNAKQLLKDKGGWYCCDSCDLTPYCGS